MRNKSTVYLTDTRCSDRNIVQFMIVHDGIFWYWSQCPRGLRHELSSPSRALGSSHSKHGCLSVFILFV
jgi:hypothetical protein